MKKSLFFILAAAILALTACQKEVSVNKQTKTVCFQATDIETRAIFGTPTGNTYPTLWTAEPVNAGISLNLSGQVSAAVTPSADFKTATFQAEFTPAETGPYTFVAFHPTSAVKSLTPGNRTLNIEFPASQASQAGTPDENAEILYAVSNQFETFPEEEVALSFHHVPAYLHLVFQNAALDGATVNGVSLTADTNITGRWFFNVEKKTFSENTAGSTISITTETLDNVWCSLVPVDLSGKKLTFIVSTSKGTLTKEITLPANRQLASGKIVKLTVDLAGVALVEPKVYKLVTAKSQLHLGDNVIIVAAASDQEVALSTTQNGNNRGMTAITKEDDLIYDPSAAVQELILEEGVTSGMYAFHTGTGYLYAASTGASSTNYLRTKPELDAAGTWDVTIGADGATTIISQAPNITATHLRYNKNNSLFSAYAEDSSCYPVVLYRLNVDAPDGYLRATLPDGASVSYASQTVHVQITGNVAWTASVSGTGATLSATTGTGNATLNLTIPENTDQQNTKTWTVTVTTTASVPTPSYELTLTQAKAPSGTGPAVGDILFFENWAGASDGSSYPPSKYGHEGTQVFGGYEVIYTESGAYTKTDGNANCKAASGRDETLLITPSGYWTVSGIPCRGVKTATLSYVINRSQTNKYVPTTTTDGVTIGAETQVSTTVGSATYYTLSFPITFDTTKNLSDFNFTITNKHSANTRFTLIQVKVDSIED